MTISPFPPPPLSLYIILISSTTNSHPSLQPPVLCYIRRRQAFDVNPHHASTFNINQQPKAPRDPLLLLRSHISPSRHPPKHSRPRTPTETEKCSTTGRMAPRPPSPEHRPIAPSLPISTASRHPTMTTLSSQQAWPIIGRWISYGEAFGSRRR